mgnify:CR=1 FL=1
MHSLVLDYTVIISSIIVFQIFSELARQVQRLPAMASETSPASLLANWLALLCNGSS